MTTPQSTIDYNFQIWNDYGNGMTFNELSKKYYMTSAGVYQLINNLETIRKDKLRCLMMYYLGEIALSVRLEKVVLDLAAKNDTYFSSFWKYASAKYSQMNDVGYAGRKAMMNEYHKCLPDTTLHIVSEHLGQLRTLNRCGVTTEMRIRKLILRWQNDTERNKDNSVPPFNADLLEGYRHTNKVHNN